MRKNTNKVRNKKIIETLTQSNELCLEVFDEIIEGLEKCSWPGRFQITQLNNFRYIYSF